MTQKLIQSVLFVLLLALLWARDAHAAELPAHAYVSANGRWACTSEPRRLFRVQGSSAKAKKFANALTEISSALKTRKLKRKKLQAAGKIKSVEKIGLSISALQADKSFVRNCRDGKPPPPATPTATPTQSSTPQGTPTVPPSATPSPAPTQSASPTPTPSPTVGAPAAPLAAGAIGGDGQVTLSWDLSNGATHYNVYWKNSSGVTPLNGTLIAAVQPPFVHSPLTNGSAHFYIVTAVGPGGESGASNETSATPQSAGSTEYDPPWAIATPAQTISFDYNPALSSAANGSALKNAILALQPGQKLEVGTGNYALPTNNFNLNLRGTAAAPIWVTAKQGENPVISMPTTSKNIIDAGNGAPAEYLVLRGLTFTGGSAGIRLHQVSNFWLDQCAIYGTADAALTANTFNTEYLYLTRNHIYETSGYGEGMYLGANNNVVRMRYSIIALNHIHDTGSLQGDGIEVKQGSYGNLIAENLVHNNNYPAILVYGTAGQAINIIERNICYSSGDNVMQVQGDAIVRNNLMVSGANGFASHDHQGPAQNLTVAHNTIINSGTAARMSNWSGRPNMRFVNNIAYSNTGNSILFSGGSSGVTVAGNLVYGPVSGATSGFSFGNGLSDFVNMSWSGAPLDARPSSGSAIIGSGSPIWAESIDITGATRTGSVEAGCYDAP